MNVSGLLSDPEWVGIFVAGGIALAALVVAIGSLRHTKRQADVLERQEAEYHVPWQLRSTEKKNVHVLTNAGSEQVSDVEVTGKIYQLTIQGELTQVRPGSERRVVAILASGNDPVITIKWKRPDGSMHECDRVLHG